MGKLLELPLVHSLDVDMTVDPTMIVNPATNPVMVTVNEEVLKSKELAEEVYDCMLFMLETTRGRYHIAAILAACQTLIGVVSANVLARIPGYQVVETSEGLKCVTSASS